MGQENALLFPCERQNFFIGPPQQTDIVHVTDIPAPIPNQSRNFHTDAFINQKPRFALKFSLKIRNLIECCHPPHCNRLILLCHGRVKNKNGRIRRT